LSFLISFFPLIEQFNINYFLLNQCYVVGYAEYSEILQGSLAMLKLREINVEDDIEEEQDNGVL